MSVTQLVRPRTGPEMDQLCINTIFNSDQS